MINKMTYQQNANQYQPAKSASTARSAERRAAVMQMDRVVISDEARELAAQRRALWNSAATDYERQALSMEWTGIPFRDNDGNFPGWTDTQANEWLAAQASRERELIAAESTHNLLGGLLSTANNGQPFTAIMRVSGIYILNEHYSHHSQRDSFVRIDPSRGASGIDQPTIRKLDFMHQIVSALREIKPPEDNNLYSADGILGNLDGLRALADSFDAVRSNVRGQGHMRPLEDAFRHLLINFFAESARIENALPDGSRPSHAEQANDFADIFFNNLNQRGVTAALDMAWANLQSNNM
ncbi:MAG: hypothetical protein FWB96_00040 [Defluviitaleaceae bacterium]|nr:hypothetical protein [Defluviitaleaceae bacterium]MCL2262567.1 hypothetical protein [Defluviitaleaceae bacterium]